MKIVVRVIITLILLVCLFLGWAFVAGNSDNVRTIDSVTEEIRAASTLMDLLGQHDYLGDIPTKEDFQRAVYVDWVFLALSFLCIIFPFTRGKVVGLAMAGALAVSGILLYALQPVLNGTGFQNDNQDKTLALVVMVLGLLAAGLIIFYKLKLSAPERPPLQPQETLQA